MKTLSDILAEIQALATIAEDQFEASLATAVADLQAVIAQTAPVPGNASDVVSISTTTASGVVAEFVPKV